MTKCIIPALLALAVGAGVAEAQATDNAWQLLEKGVKDYNAGKKDRARRRLEAALRLDGRCQDAWFYLGRIREDEGELEKAIEYYKTVEEKYPAFSLAQGRLGHIALRLKDKKSAATYFLASAKARATVDAWNQVAAVQLDLERFEAAEKSLKASEKISKNNMHMIELFGRLYLETNRPTLALERYGKLVATFPRDTTARYLRATCYLELERPEMAVKDYEKILTLDPFHRGAIQSLLRLWSEDPAKESRCEELTKRLEALKKNPPKVRRVAGKKAG